MFDLILFLINVEDISTTGAAAPVVEISSTFIRKSIKSNKNVKPLLPQKVWEYVDEMNFYK